jgi:hypothetical protein
VVLPNVVDRSLAALQRHGLQVRAVAPGDRRSLREALPDAVLLWHAPGGAPVTAELLAEAPRLRLVQALSSRAEAIHLAAAPAARRPAPAAPDRVTRDSRGGRRARLRWWPLSGYEQQHGSPSARRADPTSSPGAATAGARAPIAGPVCRSIPRDGTSNHGRLEQYRPRRSYVSIT